MRKRKKSIFKRKKFTLLLVLGLIIFFSFNYLSATPSQWAEPEVRQAIDLELVSERLNADYQEHITREEVLELAVKLYELIKGEIDLPTDENPFKDTDNTYAVKANRLNIIQGIGDGLFAPEENVNREQMATMLYRTVQSIDPTLIDGQYNMSFEDSDEISNWAKDAVGFAYNKGILAGVGNNRVDPKGIATREQVIALVVRTYNTFSELDLEVHFIDVGQGDSILVITPNDKVMLIDTGEKSAEEKIINYLKSLGINSIDKFVVTHPHSDHMGGAQAIFNNFEVKKVYDSGFPHTTKTYEEFLKTIDRKNIDFEIAQRGNKINLDNDLVIDILHPESIMGDPNNNSIVLKMTYDSVSFIFTGDAEHEAEEMILDYSRDLKSQILKLGHHGSDTSTSQEFLNAINPDVAVIQVGEGNKYGHPIDEVLERLANKGVEIYRNDLQGDIIVSSDGKSYSIDSNSFEYKETQKPDLISTLKSKISSYTDRININTAFLEKIQEAIHTGVDYVKELVK